MLRPIYLTALFLSLAAATGVCAAQQSATAAEALYKLEGTVVNAETGQPIPHALVKISNLAGGPRAMLTGPDGEFSFDKLAKGTAMVEVRKPGFFPPGGLTRGYLRNIEIGAQTQKAILKLEPEGTISGEVVNENGEPLEGAPVETLVIRVFNGRREINGRGGTRTDEDGLFHIGGLEPGKYILIVRPWGAGRRLHGAETHRVYPAKVYYPNTSDQSTATPIDLAPGQHAQARFSVSPVQAFKLSGTVSGVSAFKNVSPPMIVEGGQFAGPLFHTSRWDSQTGAFEFPLMPAGTYTLETSGMADDSHPVSIEQTVALNRDISGFNVALQAGATIPVSLRTEFSSTQEGNCHASGFIVGGSNGARSELDCKKFPAMVTLTDVESNRGWLHAEAESSDPSALALHNVSPGRYHVQIMPMVAAYVRSVRSAGTDLLREELIVPAGGSVPPIEVVLRDDGAKVKVHVQSEKPLEQARILLLAEFAPFQRPVTLDVPASGDREYGGLAPGDYRVLAFESAGELEYNNPEFLNKYSSKTARVTLTANNTASVTVELIRAGE